MPNLFFSGMFWVQPSGNDRKDKRGHYSGGLAVTNRPDNP